MGYKRLKSIQFPGLEDIYTIPTDAPDFSPTQDYVAGDSVVFQGQMYRYLTDHTAGPWDSTQVEETTVSRELVAIKASTNATLQTVNDTLSSMTQSISSMSNTVGNMSDTVADVTRQMSDLSDEVSAYMGSGVTSAYDSGTEKLSLMYESDLPE